MKSKKNQVRARDMQPSGNEQVSIEISAYLQALDSYPARFAKNPGITFEEHCSSLVETARAKPASRV